jgi:hypothetical protein
MVCDVLAQKAITKVESRNTKEELLSMEELGCGSDR